MAELRKDHAHGTRRLGMTIPASETWKRIRQLKPEFGSEAAIARRLGFKDRHLQFQADVITVRTALRVRLLYRQMMLDGLDS